MLEKRNNEKDYVGSASGMSHQIDEYYLKKDVDKLLNEICVESEDLVSKGE